MTTSIYGGYEKDIVQAHPKKDRKERRELRQELSDAIQRHLSEVKFWDSEERTEHVASLSKSQVFNLYPSIHLLVRSLEEAQKGGAMWPEDEQGPHSFTLWFARLGRQLGSRTCNRLGIKMCKDAGFTVAKGQEILAALEPSFRKAHKEEERKHSRM